MAGFTSKIEIWNLALSHVRAKAQVSDADEATKEANACRLYWDHALRLTLAVNDWAFARQIAELSAVTITDDFYLREYAYAYNLPVNLNTPRYIYPYSFPPIPFEIVLAEGSVSDRMLLTNATTPKLVYTADITQPQIMPPLFISAVSWHLAAYIGPKLTGNEKWYDLAYKMYEQTLPAAVGHVNQNYSKDQDQDPPDAPWITVR